MFDQLFRHPASLARYRTGPMLKERLAYLMHLAGQNYCRSSLRKLAPDLLAIAKMLGATGSLGKAVALDAVKRKTAQRRHLYPLALRWLRFLDRLQQRHAPVSPYAKKIRAFADHMERDQGLSPATICGRCWFVARFLNRLNAKSGTLRRITPNRIDVSLQEMLDSQGYARTTVQTWAQSLRAFFRFAETHGWCRKGLAACIRGPRVFSQASLPLGPSWDDVRRLLATTEGDQPHNIRARAILMLLATHGLRAGEVSRLRLEDIDWEREVFSVVASKTKRVRNYPLTRSVGDAILRYLREVRPCSSHRQLFLSLKPPIRPINSLWSLVARRLRSLQVTVPHYGPHALRHACAGRLLASGLSLKEIGDQLGHTDPDTTRIYAKVDFASLREVADFDLGGVL